MNTRLPIFLTLVLTSGCADDAMSIKNPEGGISAPSSPASKGSGTVPDAFGPSDIIREKRDRVPIIDPIPNGREEAEFKASNDKNPQPHAIARKIIYKSRVTLTVEDFAKAEAAVARLVTLYHGYVAETNQSGSTGGHRSGEWIVRIPVESYERFTDETAKLGELQSRKVESQDVTEEFFDLDARIKNKKVEETRLLKHLEVSTGNLKDILEVERELSRVREEIERIQGRLQLLANLTALTTVTISIYERQAYIPPESPAFSSKVSRRFFGSAENLVRFLGNVVLNAISVIPWLPVWAVLLGVAFLIYRRFVKPRLARPSVPFAS